MMGINWNRFVVLLLPLRLRTSTVFAFIRVVLTPIVSLFNALVNYEARVRYRLSHTSQVWSIEDVLNDEFDATERRIYVSNAGGEVVTLINRDTDENTLIIHDDANGGIIIHNDSAYEGGNYDAVINIPYQFTKAELYKLRALVDSYRLGGKRYDVIVNI